MFYYLFTFVAFSTYTCVSLGGKQKCYKPTSDFESSSFLDIDSTNGGLYLDGEQFNLKGASWFGFETNQYVVHGLWANDYHYYIDFLANYSFNAVRIPFSADMVYNNPIPNSITFYQMNEDLENLNALEVMDVIIKAMGDAGILVMLDMHSLEPGAYLENGLWYDDTWSIDNVTEQWTTMFKRYSSDEFWNVFALDVFNEPFDAKWPSSASGSDDDWPAWCETIGNLAHSVGSDTWLVFCEGGASDPSCSDACFWGEDLQGVADRPVTLHNSHKLVYSPHCYGPSVAYQDYFAASNFPDNMPAIWTKHYGYIRNDDDAAIVVGEWGGIMSGTDEIWMNKYVEYLDDMKMRDTFFWCLNTDSGDTGGLLDGNWNVPDEPKLNLTTVLQPNPTKVTSSVDDSIRTVCLNF